MCYHCHDEDKKSLRIMRLENDMARTVCLRCLANYRSKTTIVPLGYWSPHVEQDLINQLITWEEAHEEEENLTLTNERREKEMENWSSAGY